MYFEVRDRVLEVFILLLGYFSSENKFKIEF